MMECCELDSALVADKEDVKLENDQKKLKQPLDASLNSDSLPSDDGSMKYSSQ